MPRLFLAINLPAPLRRAIRDVTAPLREIAPDVAWVPEERLHLTLKFVGEQEEAAVAPLTDVAARVASRHGAPLVQLRDVGAFPSLRRPHVIWLGVAPDPRLELIHHDIEVACEALGYDVDGRAFRPHLTLGRVRPPVDPGAVRALARAAAAIYYSGDLVVRSIDLMQSDLGPGGPEYTTLASAALRTD